MIAEWTILMLCCLYMFWRQPFMLSPTGIFFAYYALVFPIPLLVSYYLWIPTAIFDSPRNISQDKLFFAFCQVVVGLASFGVARYTLPIITISWSKRSINRSRLVPLTVVSSIMAAGGGLWVMQRIGGISALTNNLGAVRNGLLRGLGVGTFALTVLPPTVAQFWLMHAYRTKSKYLALILSLCILSTLLGGIFGFRGTIVTLLIQVACVCYLMTGKDLQSPDGNSPPHPMRRLNDSWVFAYSPSGKREHH